MLRKDFPSCTSLRAESYAQEGFNISYCSSMLAEPNALEGFHISYPTSRKPDVQEDLHFLLHQYKIREPDSYYTSRTPGSSHLIHYWSKSREPEIEGFHISYTTSITAENQMFRGFHISYSTSITAENQMYGVYIAHIIIILKLVIS